MFYRSYTNTECSVCSDYLELLGYKLFHLSDCNKFEQRTRNYLSINFINAKLAFKNAREEAFEMQF